MKLREAAFGVALTVSGACFTVGATQLHEGLGWIVGGAVLAGLSWLVLAE